MCETPADRSGQLPRRRFLGRSALAGAGVIGASALPAATASAADNASAEDSAPAAGSSGAAPTGAFALISDTHLNPSAPERTPRMSAVFAAILARDPAVVLHCGDITDTGFAEQFELYESTVPAALADRIHYTPGNHELRWNATAGETFAQFCGPAPASFDAVGLHLVALDPAMLLQEPAHFGSALLDWLEADLRGVPAGTPIVLFQHHPVGDMWFFDDDQDRFLRLIARHDVRVLFAGHLHAEFVRPMNGMVEVTLNAIRNSATYYWADRGPDPTGADVLTVTRIDLAADGTPTTTPVVTIPLSGPRIAAATRPVAVDTGRPVGGSLPVAVRTAATPSSVGAQLLSEVVWSGSLTAPFVDLTGSGTSWRGALDVSALVPGVHGIRVRAQGATAGFWDEYRTITLPGADGDPQVAWELGLGEGVQGGLALAGDLVIAGTTAGDVSAISVSGGRGRRRWTRHLGPVYRAAAIASAGRLAIVPSTDHTLTALDTATGRPRWKADLGAPVLGTPLVTTVDGAELVVATAGTTLSVRAAATGTTRWTADIGGFCAGRAACDGDRIYLGAGDGRTHALDARTGATLWTFTERAGTDPHNALLYGPWDDRVQLAGADVVLACTVSATWGLSTADGAQRWTVPGSVMYATPVLGTVPDGSGNPVDCALLIQERGLTRLVETATGTIRWEIELGFPVFNSGAVLAGPTAWIAGCNGQLAALDLATGARGRTVRISTAYTYSAPVLAHGQVIVADQAGTVRAVRVGG